MDQVTIRFEGRDLTCRADATIAAALWENGVRVLSHSPKYGRPRGVTCARGHCTACLMRVDGNPNVRACRQVVREGMDIRRQDTGAFYGPMMQKTLDVADHFLPVGFYYKWFTRPPFISRMFLRGIRPMTGIGKLPAAPADPAPTPEDLGSFDTIVVGAGPSGLEAAARAAGRVLILDDHPEPGGQRGAALAALVESGLVDAFPQLATAAGRIKRAREAVAARQELTFMGGVTALSGYRPDGLLLRRGEQLLTVRCDRLVWAAGAWDCLGLFAGNDVPGLLGPRGLYRLLARDGLRVQGSRSLVVGGGLDFWLAAALLAARGAHPTLVLDGSGQESEVAAAVSLKWPLHTGLVLAGLRLDRDESVSAAFKPAGAAGRPGSHLDMAADLVVVCGPGKPACDIPLQLGVPYVLTHARGELLPLPGEDTGIRTPEGLPVEFVGGAATGTPEATP